MKLDQIPQELKNKPQWVCWRYELRNGKKTKVPMTPAGQCASTTAPNTWSSFEAVVSAISKFDGIGFVFAGEHIGVDLDHAISDGQLKAWASTIVQSCVTYAELSPSGAGVHLISKGSLPETWTGRKRTLPDGAIEIYSRARFFTVTGHRLETAPATIEDQSVFIVDLYKRLSNNNGTSAKRKPFSGSVQDRLEVALRDPVFSRLWYGDISANDDDDSAADLALCNKIVFYFGPDPVLVDRIFRQSKLYREKWERADYRNWTISKAIEGTYETYTPPKNSHTRSRSKAQNEPINHPGKENSEDEQPKPCPTLKNAVRIIESDPELSKKVWYDDFLRRLMTENPAREWTDSDDLELAIRLQSRPGFSKIGLDTVRNAAVTVAFRNRRHCVRDWLESLHWDQEPRIDYFFEDHFGADGNPYTRAASKNFWISLVARAYRPGCKVDTMIVLEGPQGIRKSSALAEIGGDFFSEMDESVTNYRAFAEQLQGKWLVEISELDSFSRADVTRVKSLVSCASDRFRPSYGHHAIDHPRQCVFAGTTNRDDWNKDETGARRFWPIACGEIDLDAIRTHREQFFAEAVQRFKNGECWWEMPTEETWAEQDSRYVDDPWLGLIQEFIRTKNTVTVCEILLECLKFDKAKIGRPDQMRVATCLRRSGWAKGKKERIGRDITPIWKPKP